MALSPVRYEFAASISPLAGNATVYRIKWPKSKSSKAPAMRFPQYLDSFPAGSGAAPLASGHG